MSESFIKDIAELKTEMKFISRILSKVEIVLEKQLAVDEKINVANKRILNNEVNIKDTNTKFELALKAHDNKFQEIENFRFKIIGGSIVVSAIVGTIINKFF